MNLGPNEWDAGTHPFGSTPDHPYLNGDLYGLIGHPGYTPGGYSGAAFDSPAASPSPDSGGVSSLAIPSTGGTATASSGSGGSGSSAYNINPAPQQGNGAFGLVPGPIGMPDPAGDLGHQIPGLSNLNAAASNSILSKLNGTLSPGTLNALKNAQASFGVSSGMPGSGLSWNSLYGNIAGASEAQQAAGLSALNPFVSTVSGTQTVSPALQTEIANINSVNRAAPNPAAAASYAEQLFNKYLSAMRGGGAGGLGGGGRSPAGGGSTGSPADGTGNYRGGARPTTPAAPASPTGPSSFGGASSYNPETWANWEDELFGSDPAGNAAPQPDYGPSYTGNFGLPYSDSFMPGDEANLIDY